MTKTSLGINNSGDGGVGWTGLGRRDFMKIGGAGAMLAFLAGCSPSSHAGEDKSLTLTSWDFSDPVQTAAKLFTETTGTTVENNRYPYDQYLNQLVLSARSGRLTGIVHVVEEWMSTLVTAGLIEPLDAVVDESQYLDVVREAGTYEGARFGMPWAQSAIGLVSNEKLLKNLGVDTSSVRTIDDFTQMLRHIKDEDSSLIPYTPCTAVTQLKDFIPWIWSFGGNIYDGHEVTLGDAGSREALDYWKMLLDEDLIQAGVNRYSARNIFAQERTPIYDDAPQAITFIPGQSSNPDIAAKMGPLPRPSVNGDKSPNMLWSQPLVALDNAPHTVEALRFLSTNTKALHTMFEGLGNPPATSEAVEASWFTADEVYRRWTSAVTLNVRRNPLCEFSIAKNAHREYDEAIERGLRRSASTAQALAQGREALTELLT